MKVSSNPIEGHPEASPPCSILVMCGECGRGLEMPLPIDRDSFVRTLLQQSWLVSILTPPDRQPLLFGAICQECAPRIFPPEVLQAAEERRQQMLQAPEAKR